MIDKKPFRVTNEQALAVKNMINGRPFIYASGNDIPADWFASDLLEARELIDKQEALIKEMRLSLVIAKAYNCDCNCKSCRDTLGDINSILEKTRDYA